MNLRRKSINQWSFAEFGLAEDWKSRSQEALFICRNFLPMRLAAFSFG